MKRKSHTFLFHRYTAKKMLTVFIGASVAVGEDMFLTIWWRSLKIHQVKHNLVGEDPHRVRDGVTFMQACP